MGRLIGVSTRMRNKSVLSTLRIRAGAWTSVFSIPLVATGYLAGHFNNVWLLGSGACVLFVTSLVWSLTVSP